MSMLSQQRLIPSNDDFASLQCGFDQLMRLGHAANQFNDDLNGRVSDQVAPVRGQPSGRNFHIPGLTQVADRHSHHLKPVPGALSQQVPVALKVLVNPGTHVAQTRQSNGNCRCHIVYA